MSFDRELVTRLKNVHAFVVTPFLPTNLLEIDRDGLVKNLEFLLDEGVEVIAVGGGTGEIETLSVDELDFLSSTAHEVIGEKALVISCLPGNLKQAVELIPRYEKHGAKLLLGLPPTVRGKVPSDLGGVVDYYREVSRRTSLPLMPYNTQGWPAELFVELAEIPTMIGIKDPCQNPHEFFRAIQLLGDRFVWIGNKKHIPGVAHLRYQMGMEGFTSGQSNFFPGPELAMHAAAQRRDWDEMVRIQRQIAPLERMRLAHDDAAMVKACMDLVGLRGGSVRPPRRDVSAAGREELRRTLQEVGVIP